MVQKCKQCNKKEDKWFKDEICASCYLTNRRAIIKEEIIKLMGGACQICGYNRCKAALDFHHINPEQKLYPICNILHYSWKNKLKPELEKCALICSNCHREVHAGLIKVELIEHNLPSTLEAYHYINDGKSKKKNYQRTYGTRDDYIAALKKNNDLINKPKIKLIEESNIDFSKYGWCTKASKLIDITPQKVRKWMNRYMPEFYENNCK